MSYEWIPLTKKRPYSLKPQTRCISILDIHLWQFPGFILWKILSNTCESCDVNQNVLWWSYLLWIMGTRVKLTLKNLPIAPQVFHLSEMFFELLVQMVDIPLQKLTWNLKMMVFSRNLLFQGFIFRFYVSFRWCTVSTIYLYFDTIKTRQPWVNLPVRSCGPKFWALYYPIHQSHQWVILVIHVTWVWFLKSIGDFGGQ